LPRSDERPSAEQNAARAGLYRDSESGDFQRLVFDDDTLSIMFFGERWPLVPLDARRYQLKDFASAIVEFDPSTPDSMRFGGSLPKQFVRVEEADPSPSDLAASVGEYFSDELDTTYAVILDGARLSVRRKKLDALALESATCDAFLHPQGRVEFGRDTNGAVDSFTLSTTRSRGMRFARASR
jgi:hypothetical protein